MSKGKVVGVFPVIEAVEAIARKYSGKILTVIDSVLPEGQQNKATKDVLKSILHDLWNDPIWLEAGESIFQSQVLDVELTPEEQLEAIESAQPIHTKEVRSELKLNN